MKTVVEQTKYGNPSKWPYLKLCENTKIVFGEFSATKTEFNDYNYTIFDEQIDLTKPIDWFWSQSGEKWPNTHFSKTKYRHGNPFGDVRYNWELNRLQFLPGLALKNAKLAKRIILDWLVRNPYQIGPAYLSTMEVALRWISIYRSSSFISSILDESTKDSLAGLAVSSGKFIESRLSTHSSSGNHLIIETVGLFWIANAIPSYEKSSIWLKKSRQILWREIIRQINEDGSSKEQSFWYLGFVLDALLNYLQLESPQLIPKNVVERIYRSFDFVHEMVLDSGLFPDFGDRDDGYVLRVCSDYSEPYFAGLLNAAANIFGQSHWFRNLSGAQTRKAFFTGLMVQCEKSQDPLLTESVDTDNYRVKSFPEGGMTLVKHGSGRLIFRHSPLGLEPTYGHGHADALSILYYWNDTPVLTDLGSGQYNGKTKIRDFFRSTMAHNTIQLGRKNQQEIQGPFMWNGAYTTGLITDDSLLLNQIEGFHDGYLDRFNATCFRRLEWDTPSGIKLTDRISGSPRIECFAHFHLGNDCLGVEEFENDIVAKFGDFKVNFRFSGVIQKIDVFFGSKNPFIGWRSGTYGELRPIYSIRVILDTRIDNLLTTHLRIEEYD